MSTHLIVTAGTDHLNKTFGCFYPVGKIVEKAVPFRLFFLAILPIG